MSWTRHCTGKLNKLIQHIINKRQKQIPSCANNSYYDQVFSSQITVFLFIRCQTQEFSVMRWTRHYTGKLNKLLEYIINKREK